MIDHPLTASIDISLYPLKDDHLKQIESFISRLHEETEFSVHTGALSTQLYGDFGAMMRCLTREIDTHFQTYGDRVFTIKILNGDRSHQAL